MRGPALPARRAGGGGDWREDVPLYCPTEWLPHCVGRNFFANYKTGANFLQIIGQVHFIA